MHCDESLEITLGYPHGTTKTVRYEFQDFDPAADGAGGHTELLRDLGDREEFDLLTKMTTRGHSARERRLAIVMRQPTRTPATPDFLPSGGALTDLLALIAGLI